MTMKRWFVNFVATIAASGAYAALGQAVAIPGKDPGLSVVEPFGIEAAMHYADAAALDELSHAPAEDVRMMADIGKLRLAGQLDQADTAAEACYNRALEEKHFMTATRCLTIAMGNALLRGDESSAIARFTRMRTFYQSSVATTFPANVHYWPAQFMPEIASFTTPVAALPTGLDRPRHVPFRWVDRLPTIPVSLNGHMVDAVFDTGSVTSAVPERLASDFGLTQDGRWYGSLQDGTLVYRPRYVAKVELAGVDAAQRSLVGITNRDRVIIGRDLMRQMGSIDVTAEGVDVLPTDARELKTCTSPMLEGSTFDGTNGGFYVNATVSGASVRAYLDTGSPAFVSQFMGSAPIFAPGPEWHAQTSVQANAVRQTSVHPVEGYVSVGGGAWVRTRVMQETSGQFMPGSFRLGGGSLDAFHYVMDFRQHHLCAGLKRGRNAM